MTAAISDEFEVDERRLTLVERATPGWRSEFDRLRERVAELESQVTATAAERDVATVKLQQEQALRERQNNFNEAKLNKIIDVLHREANSRGYCSDFDDIITGVGLPPRQWQYRVRVSREVTQYGYVTITCDAYADVADEVVSSFRRNQDNGDIDWGDPEAGQNVDLEVDDICDEDREPVYLDGN